jgi:hypothetical protein
MILKPVHSTERTTYYEVVDTGFEGTLGQCERYIELYLQKAAKHEKQKAQNPQTFIKPTSRIR